jgi:FMN reductase
VTSHPAGIVTVVGNPKTGSRTLDAAQKLSSAIGAALDLQDALPAIDLATLAEGLLAPWRQSPKAAAAGEATRSAALVVLGTPTYKASYSGLLKLFLDTFPAGSLGTTVVVPLAVSGGPAHRHLADIQLRPVLAELGAVVPAPSFLLEESEFPALDELVTGYVSRHGALLGAAVAALGPPSQRSQLPRSEQPSRTRHAPAGTH